MNTLVVKKYVKKIGGEHLQKLFIRFLMLTGMNNRYILFTSRKANKNKVNIDYCHDFKNIGDNIAPVIVGYVAEQNGVNIDATISETKHLYAIGSILTAGGQDCTVWGSGLLNTDILYRLNGRQLDVRCVRGPVTRSILMDRGFNVPEVFGDPALLMPFIYNPEMEKKYKVSIVTHTNSKVILPKGDFHVINVMTDDYKKFVEEIKSSELVISSSLHGIIFSEVYGIKAIFLRPKSDLLKYFDYYYSTGRLSFPIADTVEQAMKISAPEIPDFSKLQESLIKSFPLDMWKN